MRVSSMNGTRLLAHDHITYKVPCRIRALITEQYVMDKDFSVQGANKHAMRMPNQSAQEATNGWESFVASRVDAANHGLTPDGNPTSESIRDLGDAIHTLQDHTSPMHTALNGDPLVWSGLGVDSLAHLAGESAPNQDWSAIGLAVRLSMAAYMQAYPGLAAGHHLTPKTFNQQADQRISDYVNWFYSQSGSSSVASDQQQEAARQCALGNPAACD